MAISRGQLVKELEPGLNALFGLEYKRYENQHTEIFDTENSDRAFEEEVMLSGFANAQVKPEGSGPGGFPYRNPPDERLHGQYLFINAPAGHCGRQSPASL